ncbi:MAG: Flp pilus assembly protein CpaB [Geminicoccaceae bacterium]
MAVRLLLILSLLLAATGLGYVGWQTFAPPRRIVEAEKVEAPSKVQVLTLKQSVPLGRMLKDDDLVVQDVDADKVPEDAIRQTDTSRTELRGAMLKRYLNPGAVLSWLDVLRFGDSGFLAAVLRTGNRAISIGVDQVTGSSGLIWPGDHVDLILTQEMDAGAVAPGRRVVGETILSDVRVIAVGTQIVRDANDQVDTPTARTVTLEVTPDQAERVAVATRLGSISLAVRASDGKPDPVPPSTEPVFGADVSTALTAPAPAIATRMRVIQGDEQKDIAFP